MNDKICPMYKAALLSYVGPLGYLKANDEKAIKCDGAECGWWVAEDLTHPRIAKKGHCGRIDG